MVIGFMDLASKGMIQSVPYYRVKGFRRKFSGNGLGGGEEGNRIDFIHSYAGRGIWPGHPKAG
jgi:hypothetical protein